MNDVDIIRVYNGEKGEVENKHLYFKWMFYLWILFCGSMFHNNHSYVHPLCNSVVLVGDCLGVVMLMTSHVCC